MTIQRTTTTTWRDGAVSITQSGDLFTPDQGAYRAKELPTLLDLLSAVLAEGEPASTPAPWSPRVGDVVTGSQPDRAYIVLNAEPLSVLAIGVDWRCFQGPWVSTESPVFLRRATAEERKKAGLPKEDA